MTLVRGDEAPGDDRQGAVARTANPFPRRADCRRRRGASQGHVAVGANVAGFRRHDHPHHPLYRGSRADGRPNRHHQQGQADPGRGQGRADAQARPEAIDAAAPRQPLDASARARRLPTWCSPTAAASSSTPTIRRASGPASRRCSAISARPASASATCRRRRARSRTSSSTW